MRRYGFEGAACHGAAAHAHHPNALHQNEALLAAAKLSNTVFTKIVHGGTERYPKAR
jgi:hypothetical protein